MRRLILGGAQFGNGYGSIVKTGRLTTDELDEILLTAIQADCQICDVAMSYKNAVQNIGESALKSQFSFINKISFRGRPANLVEVLEGSLQILGATAFDSILIHDWAALGEAERFSALKLLDTLRSSGITKYVGISVYDTKELQYCPTGIDVVQAPLNFYKRDFVNDNHARRLKSAGVIFHARSIFNQGLLLNINSQIQFRFPELQDFKYHCESNQLNSLEGALSIFDNQDLFDFLIVGVSSANDLKAIVSSKIIRIQNLQNGWNYIYKQEISDPRTWSS
jgi:aryl-alcohol dehydrogenase-like predicted oxidoreductase